METFHITAQQVKKLMQEWINEEKPEDKEQPEETTEQKPQESLFRKLIQCKYPERLLAWLHRMIDGKGGIDAGAALLYCLLNHLIIRIPTHREYVSEFQLVGSWQGIHKYMDRENNSALIRTQGYCYRDE